MTGRRGDDSIREQDDVGKAIRRRGILAAAGAMVAGIVAKQMAEPVAAVDGPLVLASSMNQASGPTTVQAAPTFSGGPALLNISTAASAGTLSGVTIFATGPGAYGLYTQGGAGGSQGYGVLAQGGFGGVSLHSSDGSPGVDASGGGSTPLSGGNGINGRGGNGGARGGYGVYGVAGTGTVESAGVVGYNDNNLAGGVAVRGTIPATVTAAPTAGVYGLCLSPAPSSAGVSGYAPSGIGVTGQSASSVGVRGLIESGSTATNTLAVYGVNYSSGANSTGIYGAANTGNGVVGVTYGAGPLAGVYGTSTTAYGMIGNTTAAGYSGLTAITGTAGVAALGATATVATAYAAFFTGTTVVNGNFVATGGTKSAAVKDATGQHRLVYCVESPESWFEDFGTAKLVNGKADVTLDKTFAEIVHTDEYHVFVTEHGGHSGLHTMRKGPGGFTVEADGELAATKGKKAGDLSGTFSWRVVAKRKDIVGERLAKWEMPKINHPDPDKLPKLEPPKK